MQGKVSGYKAERTPALTTTLVQVVAETIFHIEEAVRSVGELSL